jgi:acyl-CoA thioesterase FadM
MTNCLFAHGVTAVTAEMAIRFRAAIEVGKPLTARAWVSYCRGSLYVAEAELVQDGQVKVTATGKFMERGGLI